MFFAKNGKSASMVLNFSRVFKSQTSSPWSLLLEVLQIRKGLKKAEFFLQVKFSLASSWLHSKLLVKGHV